MTRRPWRQGNQKNSETGEWGYPQVGANQSDPEYIVNNVPAMGTIRKVFKGMYTGFERAAICQSIVKKRSNNKIPGF